METQMETQARGRPSCSRRCRTRCLAPLPPPPRARQRTVSATETLQQRSWGPWTVSSGLKRTMPEAAGSACWQRCGTICTVPQIPSKPFRESPLNKNHIGDHIGVCFLEVQLKLCQRVR